MARTNIKSQRGATLIEALVAALLFLLGIVGLVSAMGRVVGSQADAQFRSEASRLAETMLNTIWLNVDRTTAASTTASLLTFAHLSGGGNCNFTGTPSSNILVTNWVSRITSSGTAQLPGATTAMQQILVDANNEVTINVCWQSSGDVAPRQYVLRSYIN